MRYRYYLIFIVFMGVSCQPTKQEQIDKWKKEIIDTELAFSEMAMKEGIPKAFLTFAADEAVLLRNNTLIKGKADLKAHYEKSITSVSATLSWVPDFVDVSAAGDLGYTWGKYVYFYTDSLGVSRTNEGIFHTVWKRQDDAWKFVWD